MTSADCNQPRNGGGTSASGTKKPAVSAIASPKKELQGDESTTFDLLRPEPITPSSETYGGDNSDGDPDGATWDSAAFWKNLSKIESPNAVNESIWTQLDLWKDLSASKKENIRWIFSSLCKQWIHLHLLWTSGEFKRGMKNLLWKTHPGVQRLR